MPVRVKALTDRGLKRSQNEDSHAVWVAPESPGSREPEVLALVADGMGGAQSGEIASSMVADMVVRRYREADRTDPAAVLAAAFQEANAGVFARSQSADEYHGMGTTCTAFALRGRRAWLAHVGDSRAYLVRSGAARQLTRDHSLVAELVRRGELTEEEARSDPRRNVVMRSMGIGASVVVDVVALDEDLAPGDAIVLCSDGLHGVVTDAEIAAAFAQDDLDRSCAGLIRLALERGGPDNITVVALAVDGGAAADPVRARRAESDFEQTLTGERAVSRIASQPDPIGRVAETRDREPPARAGDPVDAYDPAEPSDSLPEFLAPPTRRARRGRGWIVVLVILGLLGLALAIRWFLQGAHRSGERAVATACARAGSVALLYDAAGPATWSVTGGGGHESAVRGAPLRGVPGGSAEAPPPTPAQARSHDSAPRHGRLQGRCG
jgi:PPM family protein phosphatase